jgi:hypothetical protein
MRDETALSAQNVVSAHGNLPLEYTASRRSGKAAISEAFTRAMESFTDTVVGLPYVSVI